MGADLTGLGSIADLAKGIIDKIWPPAADPNQKLQAQLELEKVIAERENTIITAQKDIIVSEMMQSDPFTKRARPMLIYAGLFFIFLVHVFLPIIAFFSSRAMPTLTLPEEFWWAWGSVCSIWSIGRTIERTGARNGVVSLITGNK
jgi:hypothetical protein